MGKKNKNKNAKQIKEDKEKWLDRVIEINESRERWFDTIIGTINESISLMKHEMIHLNIDYSSILFIVRDIIDSGITVLDLLKENLEDIRENDLKFKYYLYDVYDPGGTEVAYIELTKEILGKEAAEMMYSGIMACEISMRNRQKKAISKCCCETANLFRY